MQPTYYNYIQVDERLLAVARKYGVKMQDILVLSVLLHKAYLNDTVNLVIPHGEFEKYFNLSAYEVRTMAERMSRWMTIQRSRNLKRNVVTLHIRNLREDLAKVTTPFLAEFYYPPKTPIIRLEESEEDLECLRENIQK